MDADTYRMRHTAAYKLWRLAWLVGEGFERRAAGLGISRAQWSVVATLHEGVADTPGGIAKHIGIDAGAVSRMADRLAAAGFVKRRRSRQDRRSVRLGLTERGEALVPEMLQVVADNQEAFFGVLSADERGLWDRSMDRMLTAAEESPGGDA